MPIPKDPNLHTTCPAAVKAKITQFERAVNDYAFLGAAEPADHDAIVEQAQWARYCLEQTVQTAIRAAVEEALKQQGKHHDS